MVDKVARQIEVQKGKRKTKTVNQEVVKRKISKLTALNLTVHKKQSDAQLARDIEIALPVELDRKAQFELVRAYVSDTFCISWDVCGFCFTRQRRRQPSRPYFVSPPTTQRGRNLGSKMPQEYDLDEQGQRIRSEIGA